MADPTYLDGIRSRGVLSTSVTDAQVALAITEALFTYSRYRPIIALDSFETVDDQQAYAMSGIDSDGMALLELAWSPSGSDDIWAVTRNFVTGLPFDVSDFHLPALDVVHDIKMAWQSKRWGGSGYQLDPEGGTVYLNPAPSADGITVGVVITKKHTTTATIKSSDRDIFLDLVESICCGVAVRKLADTATATRIKTPEYEIQVGEQIGAWRKMESELHARFIDGCARGGQVART